MFGDQSVRDTKVKNVDGSYWRPNQIGVMWHDHVPIPWRQLPTHQHRGDAGFDLYVTDEVRVKPGYFADVPHGFNIELPAGHWGWVVGRSSTLRNRGLLVNHAVIDQGYRGPMFTGVRNLGEHLVVILPGERISQLIPMFLTTDVLRVAEVTELSATSRGSAGFGSSGL